MSTFLQKELGVAMSGVKWDIGNYKLWQSTHDDVILFTTKQPVLAKGANGRYQIAVSQFRQQVDDTYKITGGSAVFTVTSAVQHDHQAFEQLKEQWRSEMAAVGPAPPANPKFFPLNTQRGTAQVLINPLSGEPHVAHNDKDIGTPGGTNSFLVQLTDLGAQEWVQGIRTGTAIPAGVKMMYEYLRMLPDVGAVVKIHSSKIFKHFSTSLKVSARGFFYGGSAQIDAAWEKMKREGDITVEFIGTGLSPDLEKIRQELVNTFISQVQQRIFDSLFEPKPKVEDAKAGKSGGFFGGANFAAKFKRVEDITDVSQEIRFKGWTWLKASMDADLTTLFSELDDSYVTEVNTEMSSPATIVVDSDPQLETTAVSWSASEGKSPESPVFGETGGTERFIVTSANTNDVEISWRAQVNFKPSDWPIVEASGSATIGEGGNQVIIKPSAWIGRHMIYLFIRDGDEVIFDPTQLQNVRLIANVSYNGPHLSRAITASQQITPFEPLSFSYPLSPVGERGSAKFSAFGVIGGKIVQAREIPINFDEESVFILASREGIELASQAAMGLESSRRNDQLASELLSRSSRPFFSNGDSSVTTENGKGNEQYNGSANGHVEGTVIAVEYTTSGPALVVEVSPGSYKSVRLRDADWADTFDDERKRVMIDLDAHQYAERIRVQL